MDTRKYCLDTACQMRIRMHSGSDHTFQTAYTRKARPNPSTERNLDTIPSLVIESMVDINFWERERENFV